MIAGFFRLLFKNIFYEILIKIYHTIFRLKKSDLSNKTIKEIQNNQLIYFFIFILTTGFILINLINPNIANANDATISKTILAHLISSETTLNPPETLITEKASSEKELKINQNTNNFKNSVLIKKTLFSSSSPNDIDQNESLILSENQESLLKPSLINDSNYKFTNHLSKSNQRNKIITYTIHSGDTISSIAHHFELNVNTVLWSNNLNSYSLIQPGDKLKILPYNGILYTIKSGDTLSALAKRYQVSIQKIISANNLNNTLKIGEKIIIPGGKPIYHYAQRKTKTKRVYRKTSIINNLRKAPISRVKNSKILWPTVGHVITQYYSWHHHAIDIANRIGTPIYAATDGKVIIARGGWNGGYGNTILLDNGNGIRTRYGHASKLLVKPGQYVKKGQIIALMGSTGNSTGPHLHFEIIIRGIRRNPLNYVHY